MLDTRFDVYEGVLGQRLAKYIMEVCSYVPMFDCIQKNKF